MHARHAAADRTPAGPGRLLTGDAVPERVAALLGTLGAHVEEAALLLQSGDDAAAHDLRVAARRLDAALVVWRGGLAAADRRRIRRQLRRWRRALAVVRDLEVAVELLDAPPEPFAEPHAAPLRAWRDRLAKRLERARRRAAPRIPPRRVGRMRARLAHAFEAWADADSTAVMLEALDRASRFERRARLALARAAETDDDRVLHAARVAIKKQRYAAEALAAGAAAAVSDAAAAPRALQRALGRMHDRARLRDLLRAHAARARARKRPDRAAALEHAARRFEAWRLEALARFRSPSPPVPPAAS